MEPARSPIERRVKPRNRCSHLAEIRFGANVTLHAIVKDISDNGAKLQLERDAWLPRNFSLCIPAIGLHRKATCRWRRGGFAGLEFDTIQT